jgi:hypothetical protein
LQSCFSAVKRLFLELRASAVAIASCKHSFWQISIFLVDSFFPQLYNDNASPYLQIWILARKELSMFDSERLKTLKQEMTHIPRGPKGSPQNSFRQIYENARMRNWGENADFPDSRSLTMKQSLEVAAKFYPNEKPLYDKEFFGDFG